MSVGLAHAHARGLGADQLIAYLPTAWLVPSRMARRAQPGQLGTKVGGAFGELGPRHRSIHLSTRLELDVVSPPEPASGPLPPAGAAPGPVLPPALPISLLQAATSGTVASASAAQSRTGRSRAGAGLTIMAIMVAAQGRVIPCRRSAVAPWDAEL